MSEDRYLNVKELAARYGVCVDCVYKWVRAEKFPHGVHLGTRRRWKLSEVVAWEAAQAQHEAQHGTPQAAEA